MPLTNGPNLNSVAAPQQQALASNYLDFASAAGVNWAQQYLPELMEKEAEVFGNRTISGFLAQVGAEESMTSDQVVWSEQGRLHLSYIGTVDADGDTNGTFTVVSDIDGNVLADGFNPVNHGIRTNDTVLIAQAGVVTKALVVETPESDVVSVEPYGAAALTSTLTDGTATLLVIGSEYGKGQEYTDDTGTFRSSKRQALEPTFKSFSNKPIIMKDYYEVSGSDASQIGWVDISK